jgi:hypothetical protein
VPEVLHRSVAAPRQQQLSNGCTQQQTAIGHTHAS